MPPKRPTNFFCSAKTDFRTNWPSRSPGGAGAKKLSASGGEAKPPDPWSGALPLDSAGGSAPHPRYKCTEMCLAGGRPLAGKLNLTPVTVRRAAWRPMGGGEGRSFAASYTKIKIARMEERKKRSIPPMLDTDRSHCQSVGYLSLASQKSDTAWPAVSAVNGWLTSATSQEVSDVSN